MTEEVEVVDDKQPVNRSRRFMFIAAVTGFCLLSALLVVAWAFLATPVGVAMTASPLLDLYVRSVLGLATATVLAYVTGSVVDYNGGVMNLFGKGDEPPKG